MRYIKNKKKYISAAVLIILIILVYSRLTYKIVTDKEAKSCTPAVEAGFEKDYFREKETGINFVKIRNGCFSRKDSSENILVEDFAISATEVRKKDFSKFIKETGWVTTAEKKGFSLIYSDLTGNWEKKELTWKNPGFDQGENHPVVHVSFYDAYEFAKWLSSKYENYKFRLPSENQWEYAAKVAESGDVYSREDVTGICDYANGADITAREKFSGWKISDCRDGFVYTSPAGEFSSDKKGLYDMLGNVWEWCDSRYFSKVRKKNKRIYGNKTKVVIRGGSFYSKPEYLRFSGRDFVLSPEKSSYDLGFRLVMIEKKNND
ncbi:MAG: formylglycine-generating enzyme family protein [Thermodesulfobacteriota bacterium]